MSKLTSDLLTRYSTAKAEATECGRHARKADEAKKLIEQEIVSALKELGRNQAKRGPFSVSLHSKPGTISYKDELIKAIGADALSELQSAAPTKEYLEITEV